MTLFISHLFNTRLPVSLLLVMVVLALGACSPGAPASQPVPDAPATPSAQDEFIEAASAYMMADAVSLVPTPTPAPSPEEEETRIFVVVATDGARANLRNAPSLNSDIVGKGNPGTTYEVVGRSEDGEWFQICCIPGLDAPQVDAATVEEASTADLSVTAADEVTATVLLTSTADVTGTADLTATADVTGTDIVVTDTVVTDTVATDTVNADTSDVATRDADGESADIAAIPAAVALPDTAWIAASVVTVGGDPQAVAVIEPPDEEDALLPSDLTASWSVDWECGSDRERCKLQECSARVTATATGGNGAQWLPIDHVVEWDEACSEFPPDQWTFEVDRFNGEERTGEFDDRFLYSYWVGTEAGEFNGVYTLDDGRKVAVWCSGPYKVELNEGNGWTSVYQGNTCHDVRTGMLVLLSYTKRWLYTGEFDGNTYDSAYFGDNETLVQRLIDTNADVAEVVPAN